MAGNYSKRIEKCLGFSDKFTDAVKEYQNFEDDLSDNSQRDQLMKKLSTIAGEYAGETPTCKATGIASRRLAEQRSSINGKDYNFLIVITDGDPTDGSIDQLKKINKELSETNNQVIIGLGIGNDIDVNKLKESYGDDRFIHISKVEELPEKMATLFEDIFYQTQVIK